VDDKHSSDSSIVKIKKELTAATMFLELYKQWVETLLVMVWRIL